MAYTLARTGLFVAVFGVLALVGARGVVLIATAVIVSALLSLWLLAGLREGMSRALAVRMDRIRVGLDEGADSEDER